MTPRQRREYALRKREAGMTWREIGELMGVSGQRASQLAAAGRRWRAVKKREGYGREAIGL
jgi:DNA-directed RNA polymerase specialized sigma subunit